MGGKTPSRVKTAAAWQGLVMQNSAGWDSQEWEKTFTKLYVWSVLKKEKNNLMEDEQLVPTSNPTPRRLTSGSSSVSLRKTRQEKKARLSAQVFETGSLLSFTFVCSCSISLDLDWLSW